MNDARNTLDNQAEEYARILKQRDDLRGQIDNLETTNRGLLATATQLEKQRDAWIVEAQTWAKMFADMRNNRDQWARWGNGLREFGKTGAIINVTLLFLWFAFALGFSKPIFDGPELWARFVEWLPWF